MRSSHQQEVEALLHVTILAAEHVPAVGDLMDWLYEEMGDLDFLKFRIILESVREAHGDNGVIKWMASVLYGTGKYTKNGERKWVSKT